MDLQRWRRLWADAPDVDLIAREVDVERRQVEADADAISAELRDDDRRLR